MNIPIKINGKKYVVPQLCDLSTKDFIEVAKIEGIVKDGGSFDTVKYIAWYLKLNIKKAFFATLPDKLHRELSYFPDIEKTKPPALDYIDTKKAIYTVGQRFQVEESSLKGYELTVFVLAVAQAESNNIDGVNELYHFYMSKPAVYILPHAFFFSKIYANGKNTGVSFLRWPRALIKILGLRNKQGHKN